MSSKSDLNRATQTNKKFRAGTLMVAPFLVWPGGLTSVCVCVWGGVLAQWVGEVAFQSVDRCTHACYWFLSRQWHLDGRLRDHQSPSPSSLSGGESILIRVTMTLSLLARLHEHDGVFLHVLVPIWPSLQNRVKSRRTTTC